MRQLVGLCALGSLALLTAACGSDDEAGFSLPPGAPDAGRAVFVDMACTDCHSIVGHEELRENVWTSMDVPLGGPTSHIRTYGELVTSIINPSHKVSKAYQSEPYVTDGGSAMRNYNEVMTVSELIDVVAFLQAQYMLVEYPQTTYSQYTYP